MFQCLFDTPDTDRETVIVNGAFIFDDLLPRNKVSKNASNSDRRTGNQNRDYQKLFHDVGGGRFKEPPTACAGGGDQFPTVGASPVGAGASGGNWAAWANAAESEITWANAA